MYAPETATATQKQAYRDACRFSAAEIDWLAKAAPPFGVQ
jgi:hypothetical protein